MNSAVLLRFEPIYQERVWGGRRFATDFGRSLPGGESPSAAPIGESWELSDRDEAQSRCISAGPYEGKTLHELWQSHRAELFGTSAPQSDRFPLLIKLLDAADKLSLQVHPPAQLAAELKGEPKTEMWYFARCSEGADIYAGLKPGVDRASFEKALDAGTVADCFHQIITREGDCMFLPSGRVHAIGGGNLIAEIQQNSDTTYRVYDWGRVGLDGKPRALHVQESLASIDFSDYAPPLQAAGQDPLVQCAYFTTRLHEFSQSEAWRQTGESFSLFFVSRGELLIGEERVREGEFALLAANQQVTAVGPEAGKKVTFLSVHWGQ